MRIFEFVPSTTGGVTRIIFDSVELKAWIDPREIQEYRYNRAQYTLLFAHNIIETVLHRIEAEVDLKADEIIFVIKYLKHELGI